jgi:hypothetical protein
MSKKLSNIGYPNVTGTYVYPVRDGKVILKPNMDNSASISELIDTNAVTKAITKKINSKKISIIDIARWIILIIFLVIIIYFVYNLYKRVTNIEQNFNSSVTNIVKSSASDAFNQVFSNQIDSKTSTIYNNVINKINSDIIPKIYSDASNAFLPSNTNAININGNFSMVSTDTLVCNNINDITSCTCLFDNCSQLSSFRNFMLIDRPTSFNDIDNYVYSGNVIPVSVDANNVRINNRFCLTFYINIIKTIPENRLLFHWSDNNYTNRYPSIIIRGNSENDYGGKYRNSLDLRFSNLGNDGIFNVTSTIRDNCLDNIPLYQWNHIAIMCNGKSISFYLNGKFVKTTFTQQDIKIGDPDQWIFIGKPFGNYTSEKNPYGILLAKMRWFPDLIPTDYLGFYANEFIRR